MNVQIALKQCRRDHKLEPSHGRSGSRCSKICVLGPRFSPVMKEEVGLETTFPLGSTIESNSKSKSTTYRPRAPCRARGHRGTEDKSRPSRIFIYQQTHGGRKLWPISR